MSLLKSQDKGKEAVETEHESEVETSDGEAGQ